MSQPDKPVTLLRDGGMIAVPVADTAPDGSSIRIPQVDTSLGADFGETITDDNRLFAAKREPIAGFLIYGIAKAITEKWFTVNDRKTKSVDEKLNEQVQEELRTLKFKKVLTQFVQFKRLYGNTLLIGNYDDAMQLSDLQNPRPEGAELKQLTVFSKPQYSVWSKDENAESLRYGQPELYQITNGTQQFRIHYTRCFEHVGDSILDLIWDDLTCGRNIRWGVGQWVYRTGGGFAVIKFPKETSIAKLREYAAAKEWSDITHRTYICILNEVMDFKFEGAAGATLDPAPFFDTNTKQIAKATGIPKSILEGAEAGALTGSELNDQQFYKQISGEQSDLEDVCKWVMDQLPSLRQVTVTLTDSSAGSVLKRALRRAVPQMFKDAPVEPKPKVDYELEWISAFELSEKDEAQIELWHAQANATKLDYMSKDEVRAEDDLPPLPNGEGKWKEKTDLFGGQSFEVRTQQKMGKANEPKTEGNTGNTGNSSGN